MKKLNLFRYVQSIIEDRKNPINLIGITVFDLDEVEGLSKVPVDGHTVWYGHSPIVVASRGAVFGLTLPIEMADGSISAMILTDGFYDQLDVEGRNFIYLHEVGHIKHGDVNKAWEITKKHAAAIESANGVFEKVKVTQTLMKENRAIEDEFAADEYAASIIGYNAAISGLRQISQAPSWLINKDGKRELRRRIAHLELRRDRERRDLATKEVI